MESAKAARRKRRCEGTEQELGRGPEPCPVLSVVSREWPDAALCVKDAAMGSRLSIERSGPRRRSSTSRSIAEQSANHVLRLMPADVRGRRLPTGVFVANQRDPPIGDAPDREPRQSSATGSSIPSINGLRARLLASNSLPAPRHADNEACMACMHRLLQSLGPREAAHGWRVARYAYFIGERLHLSAAALGALLRAAEFHDIGKAVTAGDTATVADSADAADFHAVAGYLLLARFPSASMQLAANIALTHHERWDGHGRPRGLHWEQICVEARIVALADRFDEWILAAEEAPASAARHAALRVWAESAKAFDPQCVQAFAEALEPIQVIALATRDSDRTQP